MFPSVATIALAASITFALAVIDWYVWRTAPVMPHPLAASREHSARAADDGEAFKEVA
jgi:hypothetical protein